MMASTKRDSTRAVSASVSPRPSCISCAVSRIASPPSWRMATSNETRVRVEGLSNTIASVLPASGDAFDRRARAAFIARLLSISPASTGFGMSVRSRKCRTPFAVMTPPLAGARVRLRQARAGAVDTPDRFGNFLLADDQRRQQPHHIVAGGDRDHLLGAQFVDHLGGLRNHAQADQQAFAAHFGDHRGMAVLQFGQPLLEQQGVPAARARGSRRRSRRRARHWPPPSPADCRRRSSHACRRSCPWTLRPSPGRRRPESRRRAPWRSP